MEAKKTDKANLEKKRVVFLLLGFSITLSIILLGFEWTSAEQEDDTMFEQSVTDIEEEIIPITRQNEPPPPPPEQEQVTDVLEIVEDDTELEEELELQDTEADEDTDIDIPVVEDVEEDEDPVLFVLVEDKPQFPGGQEELIRWIGKNTNYPEIAKENNIQGTVYVYFVIGKDGSVGNVRIARGVDPYLDKEAERVVNAMPKWKPGKQRGKPVKVSYQVPIKFKLQ